LKIRNGAIVVFVDNIITNLCAKLDDDRLWNEKALVDRKYDNNKNPQEEQRWWRLWTRFRIQKYRLYIIDTINRPSDK